MPACEIQQLCVFQHENIGAEIERLELLNSHTMLF